MIQHYVYGSTKCPVLERRLINHSDIIWIYRTSSMVQPHSYRSKGLHMKYGSKERLIYACITYLLSVKKTI